MAYVDGFLAAVPTANKDRFIEHARAAHALMKENGAISVVDTWGDDVPDGQVTDFKRACAAKADETVSFGWVIWPDKATRDAAWEKLMADERMRALDMPFDGKRMIFGGFQTIAET